MAVEHSLGLAGRSRRVAQTGGHFFVELGELGSLGHVGEQFFVIERGPRQSAAARPPLIHQDVLFDGGQLALAGPRVSHPATDPRR